jgi:hypothetical protein
VADAADDPPQDKFEKVKLYGVGQPGLDNINDHIRARHHHRKKALQAAQSLNESQDTIPENVAHSVCTID